MKRNFTFLKTLLVAVGLLVGAQAWGATKKVTLFSQDFESVTQETLSTVWTPSPSYGSTLVTGDLTYGNYVSCTGTKIDNNQSPNSIWFYTSSDIYTYNDSEIKTYTVEFDALFWSNVRENYLTLFMDGATVSSTDGGNGKGADKYCFNYSNTKWKESTVKITTHNDATFDVSETQWYHYKFDIDGSTSGSVSITYTITNNSTDATVKTGTYTIDLTAETPICDSYKCQGVYFGKARYDGKLFADNFKVTAQVETDEEVVSDPSIGAPAYAGANRTVAITPGASTDNDATVTTYYTLDGTTPTSSSSVYTSALTITKDCTIKAITISSNGVASGVDTKGVTVGKLTLNAPVVTMTGYSSNNYTISVTSDQSNLEFAPESPVIKYTIDGGAAQTYSSAVAVAEGSTLVAYVEADDYTTSAEVTQETAARMTLPEVWTQDYTKVVPGTGVQGVTLNSDVDFTAGGRNFYNIIAYGSPATEISLNTNVGINTATGFGLRQNGGNSGLLKNSNSSGSTGYVGFQNLEVGQIVYITNSSYASGITAESGLTLISEWSTTTEKFFRATATEASVFFPHGTYNYIYSISVLSPTVTGTITSAGWATFSSKYALDFTGITTLTAYKATSCDGTSVTLEPITGTVAANTGLVIKGETTNIPVVASGDEATGNMLFALDGSYSSLGAATGGTNYVLTVQDVEPVFAPIGATPAPVTAGHAALFVPNGSARTLNIVFGDETNGVEAIESNVVKTNNYYNLNGQRVVKPSKGLYIVNGKKVIVK